MDTPLPRTAIRAFRLIREIQSAYSQRTVQGVYKDVFVEDGKLHFTHDLSQIADGDFLWSADPLGSLGDINEMDKHAVMEFSQCTRDLANLAPIIGIILKGISSTIKAITIRAKPGPRPVQEITVHPTGVTSLNDGHQTHTFISTSVTKDGRTSDIVMDLTGSQFGWLPIQGLQLLDSYFEERALAQLESVPLHELRESFDQEVQIHCNPPVFWEKVFIAERLVLHHAQTRLETWLRKQGLEMKAFLESEDAEFEVYFERLVDGVVGSINEAVSSFKSQGKYCISKDVAGNLELVE